MTLGSRDLTAVVVNWRTPQATIQAASSLIADGSAELLRQSLPDSRVLAMEQNVGFGLACNLAAGALPSAVGYLLVNSDAVVHSPGSVHRLVDGLADPAVGVCVPRLLHPNRLLQPSVYPLPSLAAELVRALGLSRLVPQRWAPRLSAHWRHGETRAIQYAVGAVLLVRAATWEQLAGFSPSRFMYAEDLDLFLRLARMGWTARFVAEAAFVHLGGASTRQRWQDAERAAVVAAAERNTLLAHAGRLRATAILAVMAAGAARRMAQARLSGRRGDAAVQSELLRAYANALTRARARGGSVE